MIKDTNLEAFANRFSEYTEVRLQQNTNTRIGLLNGDVVGNTRSVDSGISARVFKDGVWGFASRPEVAGDAIEGAIDDATRNAEFLARHAGRELVLPRDTANATSDFGTRNPRRSQQQVIAVLKALDDYIAERYPGLTSRAVNLWDLDMEKQFYNSDTSTSYSNVTRSLIYVRLVTENDAKEPVELAKAFGGRGQFEDVFEHPERLHADIDELHRHLMNKRNAVSPSAGVHDVILDSELAGILAHEAIGHTTEADIVQEGSVAGDNVGKQVASELITMVDYAHSRDGETLPVPVYVDDEGVESRDTVLIDRAILPGNDKLDDMIASIDDGYYLMWPSNGQADSTSEFMFGVTLGYEIKNGKLGRAITDTTIAGVAFDMLKSVTMVSDEMNWGCAGMCGKKQIIPVGMGGPAVKCRIHIGGE
jgi:TldD protein